jgi:methyltransferase (TIGR00027 family)
MSWDVSSGPGVTALGLAAARSVETGRPDRLIKDPLARALFEAAGVDLPMLVDWPAPGSHISDAEALHLHGSRYIGLRTRVYDDALMAAASNGVTQGVLLGAGLDTRGFRLSLPAEFRLFELDQQEVLAFKEGTLNARGVEPRCVRCAIGVDLRDKWPAALEAGGFERNRATAWIAEGLLPYLKPAAQSTLLDAIHELAAPGSLLVFDRIAGDLSGDRVGRLSERSGIDMQTLLAGGEGEDLAALLRAEGWEVDEAPTALLAARYGRDLRDPFASDTEDSPAPEPPWLDTVFLSAAA